MKSNNRIQDYLREAMPYNILDIFNRNAPDHSMI